MKKLIIIFSAIVLMSFAETKVTLKKENVDMARQGIAQVANYIEQSHLPHDEVKQLLTILKTCYEKLGTDSTTQKP